MKRRQTLIGCAVAAALAVPFTAGAQNTTLHQYPQASGNASQVAPENARFPGPARDGKAQQGPQRQQRQQGTAETRDSPTLHQYPQASGNTSQIAPEDARFPGPARDEKQAQQDHPDLMVITIEPVAPPMTYRQRAESTFRALDRDSDGEISMAEAGVNTQLLNAFQKLDRNSNRSIDRQEFARVNVNDGKPSSQAQSKSSSGQSSAAGGGTTSEPRSSVPSSRIDERALGVQPNLPPQPVR